VTVTILNSKGNKIKEFSIRGGSNLWVFLRKNKVPIGSSCSGVGVCGGCDVKISSQRTECVSPVSDLEKETLSRNHKSNDLRLSCLCRVYEDICVKSNYW
jgi:ferredoxin